MHPADIIVSDQPLLRRQELKYFLNPSQRAAVEAALSLHMRLDAKCISDAADYPVDSLYFDSPQFSIYRDQVEGVPLRTKFRLRLYRAAVSFAALELKQRKYDLVFKQRAPVENVTSLLRAEDAEETVAAILQHAAPGPARDAFEYNVYRRGIRPVLQVSYARRAYAADFTSGLRVTFDTRIFARQADSPLCPAQAPAVQIAEGHTILELKHAGSVPGWFAAIVRSAQLQRVSFSKYRAGVEALALAAAA